MTLSERIASEIMDTIERERRINKDDLIAAAERVLQRWEKEQHSACSAEPDPVARAWAKANEELIYPPAFISAEPVTLPQSEFERLLWFGKAKPPARKPRADSFQLFPLVHEDDLIVSP